RRVLDLLDPRVDLTLLLRPLLTARLHVLGEGPLPELLELEDDVERVTHRLDDPLGQLLPLLRRTLIVLVVESVGGEVEIDEPFKDSRVLLPDAPGALPEPEDGAP